MKTSSVTWSKTVATGWRSTDQMKWRNWWRIFWKPRALEKQICSHAFNQRVRNQTDAIICFVSYPILSNIGSVMTFAVYRALSKHRKGRGREHVCGRKCKFSGLISYIASCERLCNESGMARDGTYMSKEPVYARFVEPRQLKPTNSWVRYSEQWSFHSS